MFNAVFPKNVGLADCSLHNNERSSENKENYDLKAKTLK